jgi:hypothetical protein
VGVQVCSVDGRSYGACDCAGETGDAAGFDAAPMDAGGVCIAGQQINCGCPGGDLGVQVCAPDGTSYGACACGDGAAPSDATVPESSSPEAGDDAPAADVGLDGTSQSVEAGGSPDAVTDQAADAQDATLDASSGLDASPDGSPYGLTGTPCGSPAAPAVGDGGDAGDGGNITLIADLGSGPVTGLWRVGDRVLSTDRWRWILWDVSTQKQLANGTWSSGSPTGIVGAAGSMFVVQNVSQVELRSLTDGSLTGTVTGTASGLSTDGSYVWSATASGLLAWSPDGTQILDLAGYYGSAKIYAGPTVLRIAGGPGNGSFIEDVAIPQGTSTITTASFSGSFAAWFADGTHFLTTIASNVLVYDATATRIDTVAVSSLSELGGWGNYFWNFGASSSTAGWGDLSVYGFGGPDGGGNLVASAGSISSILAVGGGFLGVLPYGEPTIQLVDLTGATDAGATVTSYPVPYAYNLAMGIDPNGLWATGNEIGAIYYQGASTSASASGHLGCGEVLAVGGSASGKAAVSMASGDLFVVNVPAGQFLYDFPFTAGKVALSADGNTLAASTSHYTYQYVPSTWTSTFELYDLAQGTFTNPLSSQSVYDFNMNTQATRLGWTSGAYANQEVVTDLTDTTTFISEMSSGLNFNSVYITASVAPALSPSGTHVAISEGAPGNFTTLIYDAGVLVNSVPGLAIGWADDNDLLVQVWTWINNHSTIVFGSMNMYDNQGNQPASGVSLPRIDSFDIVGPSRIYSPNDGCIYDLTSGACTRVSGGGGAVAGAYVVAPGVPNALVATPY